MTSIPALLLALAPQVADPELESYLAHVAAAHASLRLGDAPALRRWLDGAPAAPRGFEWDWLDAESDAALATVSLERPAYALALAPDGATAWVARSDGAVLAVGLSDGASRVATAGHGREVFTVDLDASGERLLSTAYDKSVTIWDTASGEPLLRFTGHDQPVGGGAFAPDGARVATSSYVRDPVKVVIGVVFLWDSATGELERRLEAGRKPIVDVRFSRDGRWLAAASWDSCVYLWDLEGGDDAPRVLAMPDEGIYNAVDDVAFAPNGSRVAGVSKDGTARVWDTASGELVLTLRGHDNDVSCVAWSHDGAVIATGSADASVRLWDAADGRPRGVLRGHGERVDDVAFARDGSLWSASADGSLRRWDARSDAYGGVVRRTGEACYGAVYSPDGARMATASFDGRVRLWETAGWSEVAAWQAHPADQSCHALAWSSDGARLYTGSHDGTVGVWDARTHAELARYEQSGSVQWLELAPDGATLAVGRIGPAWIWDTATGARRGEVAGQGSTTYDLAFSPDGALLALTNGDRSLRVVDVASLGEVWRLDLASTPRAVEFSPDGDTLAYTLGGDVHLVEARTWQKRGVVSASRNALVRLAWSPDGSRLAGIGDSVPILAPREGALALTLRPSRENGWTLAWSPDGTRLVTTSMEGSFTVHDRRPMRAR